MLPVCVLTLGLANIVFFFTYNRLYVKHLLTQGYKITVYGVSEKPKIKLDKKARIAYNHATLVRGGAVR